MSLETKTMQYEYLSHAAERLGSLEMITRSISKDILEVLDNDSKRLDTRRLRLLVQVATEALVAGEAAQALRDLRKRDGEFNERA
jgi:hypothetical protein